MQVQDDDKPYDDINITPMLDLAYVLLIIFMVTAPLLKQGIKVDLPKASSSASLAKPQTKAITVSDSGQIFLDAYPVTMDELENRLRTIKATTPDAPIVLKGDSAVAYQKVMDVLDLLRRLDLTQVGLVTGKQKS